MKQLFLLFLVFFHATSALRCFQCESLYTKDCEDVSDDDSPFLMECNDSGSSDDYYRPEVGRGAVGCSKKVVEFPDERRVLRACFFSGELRDVVKTGESQLEDVERLQKGDCISNELENGFREEYCTCYSHGCNAGWAVTGSALLSIFSLAFYVTF